MNKSNTICDYLQEKIRTASDEKSQEKQTLLMNLMFPQKTIFIQKQHAPQMTTFEDYSSSLSLFSFLFT